MTRRAEAVGSSYQVTLRGRFGPSFLAAFTAMGVDHAATASVFLVAAPSDRGPSDIVRMLQARGLVLLGLRRVTTASVTTAPVTTAPVSTAPVTTGTAPSQRGPDRPAQP
jgi:hypothetical protein